MAEPLERPGPDSRHFSLANSALPNRDLESPGVRRDKRERSTGPSDPGATVPEGPADAVTPFPSGVKFGRYERIEELPPGGMGIVYKAWDPVLKIDVALKTLKAAIATADVDLGERFAREARALARLDHPHIVRIYEVGQFDGRAYFAMGYMPGGSLDKQAERYASPPQAAALVSKIARAIQYVHDNGILHRDLKPANILLDEHGEPRVTDFGLAKFRDEATELTHDGAILGTPSYMAPEQARGQADQIGPATDVWALGVILYELLTGRRPFQASSREAVASLICTTEPASLRTVRPGLDRALEIITLKCLEKKPEDRFASAGQLADELDRWLAGESILTPALALRTRLRRFVGRHSTAAAVLFAIVALLLVVLPFVSIGAPAQRLETERHRIQRGGLEQVRAELEKGKAAALVPLRVSPESYERRVGEPVLYTINDTAPTVGLQSFLFGALDLLPEAPREAYRFSAEVNIGRITTDMLAVSGIYVAAIEWPGPDGYAEKWFVGLAFGYDRRISKPRPANANNKQVAPAGEKENLSKATEAPAVMCILHRYYGAPRRVDPDNKALAVTEYNLPEGTKVIGTWRRLQCDVSAAGIGVWWEGQQIGFITPARLDLELQNVSRSLPKIAGPPSAELMLRGALGLFNKNADSQFRSVTVEPLP
jgi:serine/threonine-protein kinase